MKTNVKFYRFPRDLDKTSSSYRIPVLVTGMRYDDDVWSSLSTLNLIYYFAQYSLSVYFNIITDTIFSFSIPVINKNSKHTYSVTQIPETCASFIGISIQTALCIT